MDTLHSQSMRSGTALEVQDIFIRYGVRFRNKSGSHISRRHHRVMRAIEICRTAALGGHSDKCDTCSHVRVSYNSCRNRHCPKCQFLKREQWLLARANDILPVQYFHVVFTIPDILNPLVLRNQKVLYNILFQSSSETLKELSLDKKHLGALIGFVSVLHTWGQNLMDHPHIHCIVTGGGLSDDAKKWKSCRNGFFLPVRVLSRLFRGKFIACLKRSFEREKLIFPGAISGLQEKRAFDKLINRLYRKEWVVYSKPPFKNAHTVFQYLSRYTHRIAISNQRIIKIHGDKVYFKWRDYAHGGRNKVMALDSMEFIRRFLLHVLPDKFVKIRYYGILSNKCRRRNIQKLRELLGVACTQADMAAVSWEKLLLARTGLDIDRCPCCDNGRMVPYEVLLPSRCNSPPDVTLS